jgi:hypothetical protein
MTRPEAIPPEALLSDYPPAMREIAQGLRAVVRRTVPDVIERVRPGWRLIGYDIPRGAGRSTYFCYVALEPVHVHLGFEYGTLMRDEDRLLEGAGVTRKVRWVTLSERHAIPESQLEQIVRDGLAVALMSPAERLGRMLDIDSG